MFSKVSGSLSPIESNVQSLVGETKEVHEHIEVIERDLSRLNIGLSSSSETQATGLAAVHEYLDRIEATQTTLVTALATTRGSVLLGSPSTVAATFNRAGKVMHERVESDLTEAQDLSVRSQKLRHRRCSCRERTFRYESSYTVGWLRFVSRSEKVVVHSKSCPFWNPMTESQSHELGAEYTQSALGKTIKLAMKVTRGAGGLSISPLLCVRGFVRKDSPVFALFHHNNIDYDDLGNYMDYASTRMLQLFNDGSGSPYDLDIIYGTILDVSDILPFAGSKLIRY